MDLLINATESLQVGIEDYRVGTRPRLLSAVRNIHAGILLLFKEALRRRSPANSNEVLVKARMVPKVDNTTGAAVFVGKGRKTANALDIKERFEGLGVTVDWERFDKVASLRNEIEHYFPQLAPSAVQGVIESAFIIIRGFCLDELKIDPREQLGEPTWKAMLEISEIYSAERKACDDSLERIDWKSGAVADGIGQVRCPNCGSDLLMPVDSTVPDDLVELRCRHCGGTIDAERATALAVAAGLEWEAYVAMTDGGEEPYAECPACGLTTYVFEEDRCAYCGESAITTCSRCGTKIPVSEMGCSPLCGYCDSMSSKED